MVAPTKVQRSKTPRKPAPSSNFAKKAAKSNHSILSFFKKTDKPEDSLFVGLPTTSDSASAPTSTVHDDDLYSADDGRFNEIESPNKKRRLSDNQNESADRSSPAHTAAKAALGGSRPKNSKPRIKTPFVMDSESEDDDDDEVEVKTTKMDDGAAGSLKSPSIVPIDLPANAPAPSERTESPNPPRVEDVQLATHNGKTQSPHEPPRLKHEDTSYGQVNELADFDELDDLDPDTFEGEEMRERLFMREQARLEAEESGCIANESLADEGFGDGTAISTCPICDGSLEGISAVDATRHVNLCLDGNPLPLPEEGSNRETELPEIDSVEVGKRFARAAVPRPGQANPIELDSNIPAATSAFSKIMSNNAEDSAWATAAAAENASRGRPAYERTCPFYKIMPGFSICVDAFRYGAVKDCKAYFLSHFHSDHYIGLTANWKHGPIYCSKVTGSLVKQQLRTAAEFVVEIEFDKPYDVPGTGASVTMIPANHCPGSSLFLFEKPDGSGPSKRTKRILHCGDFRACPAHVSHPLLKPDILDSVSSKPRQQKIDICYLDTTYLNPKYSFPPQGDVIKACAELCGSMSADPNCKDEVSERSAKAIGTPAVSRYFRSVEPDKDDVKSETSSGSKPNPQQRLLVICGTYSIGKERICVAIAKALGSKIYVTPGKMKICKQLDDPELTALVTSDPLEAQVHMQMIMEIRAETLQEYLNSYKPYFSRIVGFRPSGWNFRSSNGKAVAPNTPPTSVPTEQILHGKGWKSRFGHKDLVPQRGSTKEAMCFGVPYSEHSSFRELAMFVMSLRIEKIVPTVNVGSKPSRERMKGWLDRWMAERRRGGLVQPLVEGQEDDKKQVKLWEGKSGEGGEAWW